MSFIKNIKVNDELLDYSFLIKDFLPLKFGNKSKYLAYVGTYGCQQNFADSEKIMGLLKKSGFSITKEKNLADIIVFNTCAIRSHAENRVIGNLGIIKKIKENNKNLVVVVCGCMTQQDEALTAIMKSFPFVNLILGTNYLKDFLKLLYETMISKKKTITENKLLRNDIPEILEDIPTHRANNIKASIPIMYGCDNFCSYCIVPYVRGREQSRDPTNVINEVNGLINRGYKEILLLGQNVNSYGKGLKGKVNFAQLLKKLDSIPGKYWIRFMTSHPKDITKELIDVIANSEHIPAYLHLPVQSGNDRVLNSMNRKYKVSEYLETVFYIKNKIPNICISSDIIVGFPNETEKEFLDTVDLIRKVQYTFLFTFIYSKRKGTLAAQLEDKIPYEEKVRRLNYLISVQNEISSRILKSYIGTTQTVLIESESCEQKILLARTRGNIMVKIFVKDNTKKTIGEFLKVKIKGSNRTNLIGTKVNPNR